MSSPPQPHSSGAMTSPLAHSPSQEIPEVLHPTENHSFNFAGPMPRKSVSMVAPELVSESSGGNNNDETQTLHEALERHITEFDLAAYTKDEFTISMEKNIMKRMFSAFDVLQTGSLDSVGVKKLCQYLGSPLTQLDSQRIFGALESSTNATASSSAQGKDDDLNSSSKEGKMTFDQFWTWWVEEHHESKVTTETFALVANDFRMPFHQQQLLTEESGDKYTPNYRVSFFFKDVETTQVRQVSPWHDIPLYVRDLVRTTPETIPANRYNFICEIPKWTRAKFEIATGESFNPIKQDIKNAVPRFYKHGDMMWNYGAFPQTWESTDIHFLPNVMGDNDPLDAIEIGMTQMKTGQVSPVKVLGILGMIDDDEMDWKVICISHGDPIAKFLNDIDDVPKFLPGCLDALREWLRVYKICQGGVENKFAFDGEYKDHDFAMKVIDESYLMWQNLKLIRQQSQV